MLTDCSEFIRAWAWVASHHEELCAGVYGHLGVRAH